jgi:hypothetical protein
MKTQMVNLQGVWIYTFPPSDFYNGPECT